MIDYIDQIAMVKFYHLILIFLAIFFQNICDETFAESLAYKDQYPEICYKDAKYWPDYSSHKITCKHDAECTPKFKEYKSRWHPKGVCVHARNNKEK